MWLVVLCYLKVKLGVFLEKKIVPFLNEKNYAWEGVMACVLSAPTLNIFITRN